MEDFWFDLLHGASLTILFMVVLIIAKLVNDLLTPYKVDDELTEKDNLALAVSIAGYFLGVVAIFVGALAGPSQGILQDLFEVGMYSILGIVLLNISRFINDKIILRKFSNVKEIIEDRNPGTGAAQFGSYLASGLIIAGSLNGEVLYEGLSGIGGSLLTSVVFYALGQVALILYSFIYDWITPFDIHAEIEKDNIAAGVAFGGALSAIGIVLMRATMGDFISWEENLSVFGLNTLIIFILLPLIRVFFDKLIIPKSDLNHEIKNDQNIGAGILEAVISIGFAVVLAFTLG